MTDTVRAANSGSSSLRSPEPVPVSAHAGNDPGRKTWTLDEAVAVCCAIEEVCPPFGCHVALTGGTLYKRGARKDLDLLFYRIRQEPEIDMDGLWAKLAALGIEKKSGFGWCHKAELAGRKIDCFFPEEQNGEYADDAAEEMIPFDVGEAA
jgi:hypothetical protein